VTAKEQLFTRILSDLKKRSAYFTHKAIQTAINDAELGLKDSSLKVYLSQAVQQGIIHDAGRGWYSRLTEPVKLDVQHVAKLVKTVEKAFPLLDFTVWSTAQINPWMHHLLAKPVAFLQVPRETLETVGETLRDLGWDVAVNPGKREAPKAIRPGEKMVVLRPALNKQPPPQADHQDAIEKVLVDLLVEAPRLGLMDASEATNAFNAVLSSHRVQIAVLQRFAEHREVTLPEIDLIN
jgi:hypothetical protein